MKEVLVQFTFDSATTDSFKNNPIWEQQWRKVDKIITLKEADFIQFTKNLLEAYSWLPKKDDYKLNQVIVVETSNNSHRPIAIDTQGFSYPRYTGWVKDIKL